MSSIPRFFMLSTSVFLLLAATLPLNGAQAGTFVVFNPTDYSRDVGKPETETVPFSVYNPNTSFTIHIYNGGNIEQFDRVVSSAVIKINDAIIVGPKHFNQNIGFIERPVVLEKDNELSIELRSAPGSGLTVEIIGIDNEPPSISAVITPPPNAEGWNNSDVTVEFVCSDSISGVAFCTDPVLVQTEGSAQVISGTAIDFAGNETSTSVTINLDKTPPQISATKPPPNANGWYTADVPVEFDCSDNLSGIAFCPGTVLVQTEGADQVISGTAIDHAGNETSTSVTVSLDKTQPEISAILDPLPNSNGWNNSDVTVAFSCSDNLSGIASCPASVLVQTESSGQVISGTAIDHAGNESQISVTIKLDKTPPPLSISIEDIEPNEIVTTTPVLVSGYVHFGHGAELEVITVNGTQVTQVDTLPTLQLAFFQEDVPVVPGENTIVVEASDKAGNVNSQSLNLTYNPDVIVLVEKFAPQLRFDNGHDIAAFVDITLQYPISAQWYFARMCLDDADTSCSPPGFALGNSDPSTVTDNKCPTYWYASTCGKQIRIHYWWFYGFQYECDPSGSGSHHGDWEDMIVTLSEDATQVAAVSWGQHGGRYTKFGGNNGLPLTDNEGSATDNATPTYADNTHPVSYVGLASHGNFHWKADNAGDYYYCLYWGDRRNGRGPTMNCWHSLKHLKKGRESWMGYSLTNYFKWGPDWASADDKVGTQPYRDRGSYMTCALAGCINPSDDAGSGCDDQHTECMVGDRYKTMGDFPYDPDNHKWCKCCEGEPHEPHCSASDKYYRNFDMPTGDAGTLYPHPSCGSSGVTGFTTDTLLNKPDIPETFEIAQNYPNPFNPTTIFQYGLPQPGRVTIDIFNILGQRVRSLLDQEQSAGYYTITWDGTDADGHSLSSGVYFYRFLAGDFIETKKMLLLK